ncbi:hypothetical protein [Tomitella gaofuii]|nr:hypothetical protein [Tomitella gaofuii]
MREQVLRRQESARARGRDDGTRGAGDDSRASADEGPQDDEQ